MKREIVGILGGMGPIASAEFLKTIYEHTLRGDCEQESPTVMVYSDPTFPDRTDAFLAGEADIVLRPLVKALSQLQYLGASKIVICCMTIHHLLPALPDELRKGIISLPDVIFENLVHTRKRHLLVCSTGTQRLGLFQSHSRWEDLKDQIVLPDEADQHRIHRDLIYPIKKNPDVSERIPLLKSLLAKYKVDSFIVGCSEVHLIAKHLKRESSNGYDCVDPFAIIAGRLAETCS
jgi:aspartate racemase